MSISYIIKRVYVICRNQEKKQNLDQTDPGRTHWKYPVNWPWAGPLELPFGQNLGPTRITLCAGLGGPLELPYEQTLGGPLELPF